MKHNAQPNRYTYMWRERIKQEHALLSYKGKVVKDLLSYEGTSGNRTLCTFKYAS